MTLCAMRAAVDLPPREANGAAPRVVLRRTGARPLCFNGTLVHAAEAAGGAGQSVIRLAIYRCAAGFAVSLSHEPIPGSMPALSWHHAALCPTLERALAVFETVQPPCDNGVASPHGSAGACLVDAAERVRREAALLHAFRNAVGGFLFGLCQQNMPPVS